MMPMSASSAINLPFTSSEWKFFAAVVFVNLALHAALMLAEHWLLVHQPQAWHYVDLVEGCSVAVLFAQIGVLAVWASLFAGSHLLRVLLATMILCLSYYLLHWFAQISAPRVIEYRRWARLSGLPMLVLVFYAAQLPYWMLRFFWSLRVTRFEMAAPDASEVRRYTVLQMLGWAAFLSLPLSLVQLYHGLDTTGALLTMACLMLVMWIFCVLYLWATLGARRLAVGLLIALPAGIATMCLAAQLFLWLSPRSNWREIYLSYLFALVGVSVVGLGTGIAARMHGYRLRKSAITAG
jgi:hypothetical protein